VTRQEQVLLSACHDPDYSLRSATIGSTPAARRTGATDANSAARASSIEAPTSITGSYGCTPYNWSFISFPARIANGISLAANVRARRSPFVANSQHQSKGPKEMLAIPSLRIQDPAFRLEH
jgi:hypothetical protein